MVDPDIPAGAHANREEDGRRDRGDQEARQRGITHDFVGLAVPSSVEGAARAEEDVGRSLAQLQFLNRRIKVTAAVAEFIERHPDAFGGSTLDAENTYCRRVQEVSVSDANTPSELDEVADFFGGLAEWLGYTDATTVAQMLNELADRSRAYLGWYGADEP